MEERELEAKGGTFFKSNFYILFLSFLSLSLSRSSSNSSSFDYPCLVKMLVLRLFLFLGLTGNRKAVLDGCFAEEVELLAFPVSPWLCAADPTSRIFRGPRHLPLERVV